MKTKWGPTSSQKSITLDIPDDLSAMPSTGPRSLTPSSRSAKVARVVGLTFAIMMIAALIGAYLWLKEIGVFDLNETQIALLKDYKPTDVSIVYDKNGQKIGELYSQYRMHVPYDALPDSLVKAIIATEDKNFFNHHGIDARAIIRAALSWFRGSPSHQGASTITQQVIRYFLLTQERTFERKVREAALALFIEQKMTKKQIFEIYVNSCFLGNGAYGVGAAAKRYFNKNLDELGLAETTLIAGLFQSPSRYNPIKYPKLAKKRQVAVISAMLSNKFIDRATAGKTLKTPLVYASGRSVNNNSIAPYFVDYVAGEAEQLLNVSAVRNQGLRIYTTLDVQLQKVATETMSGSKFLFERAERALPSSSHTTSDHTDSGDSTVEGGLLVTDPRNGNILAMVGGRDYNTSQFNVTFQAKRQPGSAFKPVVYSLALDNGFKWSDLLYISRVAVDDYRPQNFSNQFGTETTLLRAFYQSINTAAVDIGTKIGLRKILERAFSLGIQSPLKEETGSMLGSSEVTMLDMATMYGTFATLGTRVSLSAITRITDRKGNDLYVSPSVRQRSKTVLSAQTGYLMFQGMKAVLDHGTAAKSRGISPWAAGKTGTSNNSKDNWFCGFTPNLVTIVWVGTNNKYGLASSATGASLALPLWDEFMNKAFSLNAVPAYTEPVGIVSHMVDPRYGNLDDKGIQMYFREGQEPRESKSDLKVISSTNTYRVMFD